MSCDRVGTAGADRSSLVTAGSLESMSHCQHAADLQEPSGEELRTCSHRSRRADAAPRDAGSAGPRKRYSLAARQRIGMTQM